MDDQDQARDSRLLLVAWGKSVPRPWALLLAILLQVLILPFFFLPRQTVVLTAVPETYQAVAAAGGGGGAGAGLRSPLHYSAKSRARPSAGNRRSKHIWRGAAVEGTGFAVVGSLSSAERATAQKKTAAITSNILIRQTYGFFPGHDYQLAVQTAGVLPLISPDELPPRYEQFVTVEVTIDSEGRVQQARVISGQVSDAIQHKLLLAIREFRYRPATQDGIPIPSQRDIVVHVPS